MGKAKTPPAPAQLSMIASKWTVVDYSENGMPQHPTQVGAGWMFNFPGMGGKIGYLMTPFTQRIIASKLRVLCSVFGSPVGSPPAVFDYSIEPGNVVGLAANTRLVLFKDWTSEFGRWWSNPHCIFLGNGAFMLEVPLIGSEWTSVYGARGDQPVAATSFARMLAAPKQIGLAFGGGSFFSHGVRMSAGTARFTCQDFRFV